MASITYDGQSISIDGRRRWLVAGTIDYTRIPPGQWADRLADAKQLGLNTICAPLRWSAHERTPGKFDFEGEDGELDIAQFIKLIDSAGMLCILRVGPYIDGAFDLGGIPPAIMLNDDVQLRATNEAYMRGASKWLSQAMGKVRELQVTRSGPIALIQVEHKWYCGDEEAALHLGALNKTLREHGASVPFVNANNLYARAEGDIDGWNDSEALLPKLRQLGSVAPDSPRIVTEMLIGDVDVWGAARQAQAPEAVMARLAEALAGGGQFNLWPLIAGVNFGFDGGRIRGRDGGLVATSAGEAAPIGPGGARGELFDSIKRVCMFASSFESVLASFDSEHQCIALSPPTAGKGVSIAPVIGAQGGAIFVFGDLDAKKRPAQAELVLPNGRQITADLRDQPVAMCLFDVHLSGRARLDVCSFNAFALVGSVFVCYGRAGATGVISVSDVEVELSAPTGKTPVIEEIEGATIVLCNKSQIDATCIHDGAIYVGVSRVTRDGEPIAHDSFAKTHKISREGVVEIIHPSAAAKAPRSRTFTSWEQASVAEYVDGSSDRFARIDAPASLEALGAPYGYGWLRVELKNQSARQIHAGFPLLHGRSHVFLGGKSAALLGAGPGATEFQTPLSLKKGEQTLTLLLENPGRWSGGLNLEKPAGLPSHVYAIKPFKAGRATRIISAPVDPLTFRSPLWGVYAQERTEPERITWEFTHRKKSPIILEVQTLPRLGVLGGLVILNDEPVFVFDDSGGIEHFLLTNELLRRGKNIVQIAPMHCGKDGINKLEKGATFFEGVEALTDGAALAFARWEPPASGAFTSAAPSAMSRHKGVPTWWRTSFKLTKLDATVFFDANGLTKGQLYLNGRNLCRYFVATETGKKVPPQTRYELPAPWLRTDKVNELMIFDENGASPAKCRLAFAGG